VLNITIDWGLMVCAVDLIVPKIVSSVWSGGRLFMGLPVAAALTHFEKQTKRGHVETKDAVHISFTSWQAICSGMLKMGGRNVYSKSFVHSYRDLACTAAILYPKQRMSVPCRVFLTRCSERFEAMQTNGMLEAFSPLHRI
jgi:hypothetical protein